MTYFGQAYFGHDHVWPRPCLATTLFGTTLFGQADFGHGQADFATSLSDFGDNLKMADLGRFWSGGTNLGQLWPPALPWPIWEMAWPIFGGQTDLGQRTPPALCRTALRRTALRRTALNFALFFSHPIFILFSGRRGFTGQPKGEDQNRPKIPREDL